MDLPQSKLILTGISTPCMISTNHKKKTPLSHVPNASSKENGKVNVQMLKYDTS